MAALLLAGAIVAEVSATLALRASVQGRRAWYALVLAGYVTAFTCLSRALAHGMALGVAYGTWSAVGVALTAVASRVLFREPLTLVMTLGIVLIMGGVLLIEVGAGG